MKSTINIYDQIVKFPTAADIKANGGRTTYLMYVTPFVGSLVEYSGRTCYRSFSNIKDKSYEKFISNIVKSGHESVIEHSNLVYAIFKVGSTNIHKDCDLINRHLINVMMYNGLINVSETLAFYVLSGNIRMFKDLIRKYYSVKSYNNKVNPILDDIVESFYELPKYFFLDMINSGILDESKFNTNPIIKDSADCLSIKKLNDYVSVLNHDDFALKVRAFVTTENGQQVARRVEVSNAINRKHNRITLEITAPRYITHQLVRHRMASYSQASQRYCLEEGLNVYIPETFKTHPGAEAIGGQLFKNALDTYKTLIDEGVPKEDARAVLTNAQMSTVIMTGTVESFDHFVEVRADKAAQNFIRDMIAVPLKEYMAKYDAEHVNERRAPRKVIDEAKSNPVKKKQNGHKNGFKPKYKSANRPQTPNNGGQKKTFNKPAGNNQKNNGKPSGGKPFKKNNKGGNKFKKK